MHEPAPEENKKQLMTLLVLTLALSGGFMAMEYFGGGDQAPGSTATGAPEGGPEPATADGGESAPTETAAPATLTADLRASRQAEQRTGTIRTPELVATFTDLNTAMTSLQLLGERFEDEGGHGHQLVTTDREEYLPLRLELGGVDIPLDARWQMEQLSETALRFTWSGDGFTVVRRIEAGQSPYELWSTLVVRNEGPETRPVRPKLTVHHYVERSHEDGGGLMSRPSAEMAHAICLTPEELIRADRQKVEGLHGFGPGVQFAGVENVYFATALAPDGHVGERCQLGAEGRGGSVEDPLGTLFVARLVYPRSELAGGATDQWRTLMYVGPKDMSALHRAGHGLSRLVDLGWFSFIGEFLVQLLSWIQSFVGNWGIAIILMTIVVKVVLFPLTMKSFESMARMRILKPEMDRINELYADDREKKGAAVMELYRKHKINPLGGCLPSLLQLPIWFALYQSLSTNIELYHAPFALYWTDLSSPDPYYLLPLVLGGLMFLQQKLTPTTMDPVQAKVMLYFMPIMITVFMLFLPAGLCLYMVTNSALGIAQQKWIHWRLDQQTAAAATAGATAGDDDSEGDDDPEDSDPESATRRSSSKKRTSKKKRQRRG